MLTSKHFSALSTTVNIFNIKTGQTASNTNVPTLWNTNNFSYNLGCWYVLCINKTVPEGHMLKPRTTSNRCASVTTIFSPDKLSLFTFSLFLFLLICSVHFLQVTVQSHLQYETVQQTMLWKYKCQQKALRLECIRKKHEDMGNSYTCVQRYRRQLKLILSTNWL